MAPPATAPPAGEQERTALAKRAAVASLVGTAVEWYDYFIFGTASALVFGDLFFPNEDDPIIGTLSAFAVFGVGFFARPVGGVVFGHFGDKFGRKAALVTTLMMMGGSTFLIGLMPTTDHIGIWAPILLVLLRLVQGFGVGGEWGGASLVAVEYAPPDKRGAYGSFPQIGNAVGLVLSTAVFALVSMLPDDQLFSWGWRLPFLLSAVLIGVGLFIRFRLTETPTFQAAQDEMEEKSAQEKAEEKLPVTELFRRFRRPLLLAMGMRLGEAVFGYIILTIGLTFAENYTDIPRTHVLVASSVAAAAAIFTYYWFGQLSDRIGRRAVFVIGSVVGIVVTFPFFWILDADALVLTYVIYTVAYAIGVGAVYGVEPAFFAELFSTKVRYTGLSLSAQIPSVLIGLWPLASTALLAATDGDPWPIALITVVCLLIGLVCALLAPETNKIDMTRVGEETEETKEAG
ncbi:MFS transporter [Streptomyces olivaceus]|uniref:MHS family MFS transporter n=1 Tax=Streptomyces olivaceus TaxID=47716 RepID=A0ABS7W1Z9_STROV|nr:MULTISPECIES: MFS transporter [Streptomyces]MBZ6084521.1 MHS family MFS transporter [Streptomyces olivaceus]MBZ6088400.1 MHS family MFS transporter [Streptomyces olivaceus]MBZ6094763.1 MHS family MFS transporter [Streptomyces olivaceus]MBZ6116540.1 MHS family MFS transporter [Streptomyces olivaceus]MBZ6151245.1 MHS family MFS transporter [Streptomyces olivaceus]